jgi:hypothetical protein
VDLEPLTDDLADAQARVQGAEGILEDDLQLPALPPKILAPHAEQVGAGELDLTGGGLE